MKKGMPRGNNGCDRCNKDTRIKTLETALRYSKVVVRHHAGDTVWASECETLCDYIDGVLSGDNQEVLFTTKGPL